MKSGVSQARNSTISQHVCWCIVLPESVKVKLSSLHAARERKLFSAFQCNCNSKTSTGSLCRNGQHQLKRASLLSQHISRRQSYVMTSKDIFKTKSYILLKRFESVFLQSQPINISFTLYIGRHSTVLWRKTCFFYETACTGKLG